MGVAATSSIFARVLTIAVGTSTLSYLVGCASSTPASPTSRRSLATSSSNAGDQVVCSGLGGIYSTLHPVMLQDLALSVGVAGRLFAWTLGRGGRSQDAASLGRTARRRAAATRWARSSTALPPTRGVSTRMLILCGLARRASRYAQSVALLAGRIISTLSEPAL